jgi:hypothetical protein
MRLSRKISKTEARPGAWPPTEIATILVVSSTLELLSWWLQAKKPLTVEEVAEILDVSIITPSVRARGATNRKRKR